MLRLILLALAISAFAGVVGAAPLRQDFSDDQRSMAEDEGYARITTATLRMERANRTGEALSFLKMEGLERLDIPSELEGWLRKGMGGHAAQPVEYRSLKLFGEAGHALLAVCGEMNGRNIYGAFTGFEPFLAVMVNPGVGQEHAVALGEEWIAGACDKMNEAVAPTS
jgi:hypothetical protein